MTRVYLLTHSLLLETSSKRADSTFDFIDRVRGTRVRTVFSDETNNRVHFFPPFALDVNRGMVSSERGSFDVCNVVGVFVLRRRRRYGFFVPSAPSVEKFDEEAEEERGAYGVDCCFIGRSRGRRITKAGVRETKLRLEKLFQTERQGFSIWNGSEHVADDGFDSELRKRRMREHAQNWNPVFREEEFAANFVPDADGVGWSERVQSFQNRRSQREGVEDGQALSLIHI